VLCHHRLPDLRLTCLLVGAVYVLIAGAILVRGADAMGDYAVPAEVIASAHYADAITWVYVHMLVLGLLIATLGTLAVTPTAKRWVPRGLLAVHLVYLLLDVRTSDSALGNALYRGPASLAPAIVGGVVALLFVHLSVCRGEARG